VNIRTREYDERHAKLDEQRKDYEFKLKIIKEIEREKNLREEHDKIVKEIEHHKRATEVKKQAQ
jgi:hypothetical protein